MIFAQGEAIWNVYIFTFSMNIAIIRCSFYSQWRFCPYHHHPHNFWSINQYSEEKSLRHLKQFSFPTPGSSTPELTSTAHLSSTALHAKGTEADHNKFQVTQETRVSATDFKMGCIFNIPASPMWSTPTAGQCLHMSTIKKSRPSASQYQVPSVQRTFGTVPFSRAVSGNGSDVERSLSREINKIKISYKYPLMHTMHVQFASFPPQFRHSATSRATILT